MIKPDEVPTIPWKGCESSVALLTQESYAWDSGERVECYDSDPVLTKYPQYKLTLNGDILTSFEMTDWFQYDVKYGSMPFALYCDWGGAFRWYVVKFIKNSVRFTANSLRRKVPIEVYVLGHADTVTPPTQTEPIMCGDTQLTEDECGITTGAIVGTATDITYYKEK